MGPASREKRLFSRGSLFFFSFCESSAKAEVSSYYSNANAFARSACVKGLYILFMLDDDLLDFMSMFSIYISIFFISLIYIYGLLS